jgi:predicted nucleic acid-binding protein
VTLVLDASVLLKWFVEEPGSQAALAKELDAALVTADNHLSRAASPLVRTTLIR